jgi:hypothetical protein
MDLSIIRADRFVKEPIPEDELKERCRRYYAYHYWRKMPLS